MFVRVPDRNPSMVTEKLEATQTWFSVTVEMLSEKPLAFVWKMLGNMLEVLPSRSQVTATTGCLKQVGNLTLADGGLLPGQTSCPPLPQLAWSSGIFSLI